MDIDDAMDQMSDEAMVCRDISHSWRSHVVLRIKGGYERQLRCSSCGTLRIETLNSKGGLIDRYYEYAEGYRVKGLGRISGETKDAVRLVSLQKAIYKSEMKETG